MTEIEELAKELVEVINMKPLRERREYYGITYMLDAYKALEVAIKRQQTEEKADA